MIYFVPFFVHIFFQYTLPSNIAGSRIRIRSGSAGKHWLEAGRMSLAHRLAFPEQMCLAKPSPGHPDRIRVGFAQYDLCLLWKNGPETDARWPLMAIKGFPV